MKVCTKCLLEKPVSDYTRHSKNKDGLSSRCRSCLAEDRAQWVTVNREKVRASNKRWKDKNKDKGREYVARWSERHPAKESLKRLKKRAGGLSAVPPWFEEDRVAVVYEKAREMGFQVDHIVPINSPAVCGLHCWANLQLLTSGVNTSKGNRHWPDMPE